MSQLPRGSPFEPKSIADTPNLRKRGWRDVFRGGCRPPELPKPIRPEHVDRLHAKETRGRGPNRRPAVRERMHGEYIRKLTDAIRTNDLQYLQELASDFGIHDAHGDPIKLNELLFEASWNLFRPRLDAFFDTRLPCTEKATRVAAEGPAQHGTLCTERRRKIRWVQSYARFRYKLEDVEDEIQSNDRQGDMVWNLEFDNGVQGLAAAGSQYLRQSEYWLDYWLLVKHNFKDCFRELLRRKDKVQHDELKAAYQRSLADADSVATGLDSFHCAIAYKRLRTPAQEARFWVAFTLSTLPTEVHLPEKEILNQLKSFIKDAKRQEPQTLRATRILVEAKYPNLEQYLDKTRWEKYQNIADAANPDILPRIGNVGNLGDDLGGPFLAGSPPSSSGNGMSGTTRVNTRTTDPSGRVAGR